MAKKKSEPNKPVRKIEPPKAASKPPSKPITKIQLPKTYPRPTPKKADAKPKEYDSCPVAYAKDGVIRVIHGGTIGTRQETENALYITITGPNILFMNDSYKTWADLIKWVAEWRAKGFRISAVNFYRQAVPI